MTKARPVPGDLQAQCGKNGKWYWTWAYNATTYRGNPEFDTKTKAMAAGRKFARKATSARPVEDDE